jgi:hypothetical protein
MRMSATGNSLSTLCVLIPPYAMSEDGLQHQYAEHNQVNIPMPFS